MDAKRLLLTPFLAGVVAAAVLFGAQAKLASAEVPATKVPPTLAAAIKADVEARGYIYAGDGKFDAMYSRPGTWTSFVQSIGPSEAVVTYGRYASDEIITVKFVPKGNYGWTNPATGISSPERVPLLSAQPGAKADSWVITGIDFPANQDVTFFDGSGGGGEMRVPTDHTLGTVKAGADGAFTTTLQLSPEAKPVPGQVNRLIQASNGSFIQVRFHHEGTGEQPTPTNPTPTVPTPADPSPTTPATPTQPSQPGNPTPANPTPSVPQTGDLDDDGGSDNEIAVWGLGVIAAAALGGLGIVAVSRRK